VYKAVPLDESDTKISWEVSMASEEGGDNRALQDPASVRAQLDLILASPEFLAPERGRRFLQYIVEETLEGRSEQLKAYTIAQAVFGRDSSFDAQNDPVVRIEAGRIRRALERYYLVSGHGDRIRITVPKGGYAPQFSNGEDSSNAGEVSAPQNRENKRPPLGQERRVSYRDFLLPIGVPALFGAMAILALVRPLEAYLSPPRTLPAPATSTLKSKTRIVVAPFVALGGTAQGADFAKGLADQLIAKLMRVENLIVFAPGRSGTEIPGSLFNLQGSATVEGMILHLHVRMINDADGTVIWANQYDRDLRGQTILDVEDEIAAQIAMEISNSRKLNGAGADP
jgi:TolB-like protein